MLSDFMINNIIIVCMTEGEDTEKQSLCSQLRTWFVQLSFWKKIILIFTLNTCILLILTDTIMLVLFGKISDDIVSISNTEKEQFNQISNTQIAQGTARMFLSSVDFFANVLAQLASSYSYFSQNPNFYTSLQGTNPQYPYYTSTFTNVSYSEPAYFALSSNTTFTPLPYLDELLPQLLASYYYQGNVQRINIYVQNTSNTNDLSARTFPATNQFTIPNLTTVTLRFQTVSEGYFNISAPYIDSLSTSPNKTELVALRTLLPPPGPSLKLMLEIELQKTVFSSLLSQIYYFPSAQTILAQQLGSGYTYFTSPPSSTILPNISDYYKIGTNRVIYSINVESTSVSVSGQLVFVSAAVGLANSYPLGAVSSISNQTTDPLRCIVVVNAAETQKPANQIQSFLSSESNILTGIVLAWSLIILLSTVALATVVGNYIFFNLKMLSTKMDEYIKQPSKFHDILRELKELEMKGILKRLSDNLIAIIEKIEVRKKERKDRIDQNYHPLSVGEPKFQERQQLNDYQILEQVKEQVRLKVEPLQKEYNQKERERKEREEQEREAKEREAKEREAKEQEAKKQEVKKQEELASKVDPPKKE